MFVRFLNCTVDISTFPKYTFWKEVIICMTKFGELCFTSWGGRVENVYIKFFGITLHICVFFHLFIQVFVYISESRPVVSDSLQPHGL